jgi:hypothetical protein
MTDPADAGDAQSNNPNDPNAAQAARGLPVAFHQLSHGVFVDTYP